MVLGLWGEGRNNSRVLFEVAGETSIFAKRSVIDRSVQELPSS